ncbi:testis-expressed protein 10 [Nephila pilipes]|uniref:Testis-expressed protein 10 n=1 Tax=Nephila pilipes TaxID=299642 RepID=A0A8X6UIN5_NEPPI|nr:testis-expressed protein 10 [Nephila pilipes]
MKKKAVKDFHKKKLKVGKHLPKGKNETDTSFKSKKICIPVRHGLEIPSDTSFKDMLRGLSSRDANIKYDNLRKLDLIKNPDFSHQIRFIICYQLIKGFPYTQRTSFIKKYVKKDETECMQLNLAICYLYSMFILNTENATVDMENSILSYMMDVFRVSGTMCEKTIILTLKTSKNFIQSKNVGESFKNGIMLGLYGILEVHRLSPIADLLYSFFMDLSLNYDFKYLVNSEGMIVWFNSLIKNLNFMMESKVVKKSFLKYVEQVCMRRYSHFMELLNSISTKKFIEFLQFDDEEFQLTVIHLIASLDVISSDFLQDICEAITHEDFSLKTASRVICLLHCRFSKPNTSSIDQINFVKFLLNVGCDCLSLESDPEPEKRLPLHDPIMEAQQNCLCSFKIYPTSTAEKHLKIFEVCCDCLTHYIKTEIIPPSILYFMSSLCSEFREFPVHVAIAVMELAKRLPFHYSEELTTAFNKMFFSSAVYLSLVTNEAPEENWSDYVLPQLQNSLDSIDLEPAFKTIEHNISTYGTNDVYLILRVIFFLFESSDTVSMNRNQVYKFMDIVGRTCRHDRTLFSMWVNLCKMHTFLLFNVS